MDFCVNPSKFSFPGRLILLSSSPNLLINLPDRNKQNPQRKYPLYLWPRSKVWMRAHKASIQTAATKVTNIGYLFSSRVSVCHRIKPELLRTISPFSVSRFQRQVLPLLQKHSGNQYLPSSG